MSWLYTFVADESVGPTIGNSITGSVELSLSYCYSISSKTKTESISEYIPTTSSSGNDRLVAAFNRASPKTVASAR